MRSRQIALATLASGMMLAYAATHQSKDSILTASTSFGKAFAENDIDGLWKFVPQDERTFYKLDKEKFRHFWNEVIRPTVPGFNSYRIQTSNSNGIMVRTYDSSQTMPGHWMDWQISGQRGHYYVPYFIASAMVEASCYDANDMRPNKSARFERSVKWLDKKMLTLTNLGFSSIRRGPSYPDAQPLFELRNWMAQAVVDIKAEESASKVAQR